MMIAAYRTTSLLFLFLGAASAGDTECPNELNSLIACSGGLANEQACVACYSNSIPSSASSCQDIENQFCASFESCESFCGSCMDEVIEYFDCAIDFNANFPDCFIDCPNIDTGGSTSSGGSSSNCPTEESLANTCLDGLSDSDVQACVTCYGNAIPDSASSCLDIEDQFCTGMASCESVCGSCLGTVIDFFDCSVDFNPNFPDCNIDCPGVGAGGGTGGGGTGGGGLGGGLGGGGPADPNNPPPSSATPVAGGIVLVSLAVLSSLLIL